MAADPFPQNAPSWLRETTSNDPDSIWEGAVGDVWRYGENQWQASITNNRNEDRQLVITRVGTTQYSEAGNLDYAEFGRNGPNDVVQQYWMGLEAQWNENTDFYFVHAKGREISGQRTWEANFQLPKAYYGPHDTNKDCPHRA